MDVIEAIKSRKSVRAFKAEPVPREGQLEGAIADFVDYYNFRRYHKALSNVTPADVLYSRGEEILERRKEVQIQTINRRRDYNRGLRELVNAA